MNQEITADTPYAQPLLKRRKLRWGEEFIKIGLFLCAIVSVFTTSFIVLFLVKEAYSFFIAEKVTVWGFVTGTDWSPVIEPQSFGVLPLICGTAQIMVGSSLIAIPVGLMTAIYLREYASNTERSIIKPILEILAGIPTIVYGYFAVTFITPQLKYLFPSIGIFNAASASIVVGVMVLPMVASLCDDALRAVPVSLRQGAYALGATSLEVNTRVVVPAALSGIIASFVLAASRAIGETMAVTLAAGNTPNMTLNPLESIQTMTAYIVQMSFGDTEADGIKYKSLFAVALLLFAITLVMNIISRKILQKFQETYD